VKHQPVKQGQTTTRGISFPTLSDKCVGSLMSPANHITLKMQETGLRLIVLIREDLNVQPFAGVITKAARSAAHYLQGNVDVIAKAACYLQGNVDDYLMIAFLPKFVIIVQFVVCQRKLCCSVHNKFIIQSWFTCSPTLSKWRSLPM